MFFHETILITFQSKELKTEKSDERDTSGEATGTSESRQDSGEKSSRQNSRTRSESITEDGAAAPPGNFQRAVTWAEPRVALIQSSGSSNSRSLLLAMRAEYTSITDELESYCGLLSPPRTPPSTPPPQRSQNPVELAWQIENEHLRDAEECDYQQMKDLIQRR